MKKNKFNINFKKYFSAKHVFLFLGLLIISFTIFVKSEFNNMGFEQLIFAITNSKGSNYTIVYKGILIVSFWILLAYCMAFLFLKLHNFLKISIIFKFYFKDKCFKFKLFHFSNILKNLFVLVFFISSLVFSIKSLSIDTYFYNYYHFSNIFDELYVSPSNVNITFPKKKRNLIYIFVESLESSNASIENGGLVYNSYTPKLEKLALENINFSGNNKIGGAMQLAGTTWTAAALVSHTAGIPLKVPIDGNKYFGGLPGIIGLGEILENNGYKNYFMLGSDASISGRRNYFLQHGNYEIYDYIWAKKTNKISKDYYKWWGYEDAKLFKYAQEKLLDISKKSEPFNFTMLTADTHFTDGYMDKSCKHKFKTAYANAFYCSDSKIYNFVEWIKKQDFYKDTTIVIAGDHLTMQSDFYSTNDNNLRNVFNLYINSSTNTKYLKNRKFSTLDYFPTTLASIGANIEGNKLGLGVNLFSGEKTLIENYGFKKINDELSLKSFYYDKNFLGDTYYDALVENH